MIIRVMRDIHKYRMREKELEEKIENLIDVYSDGEIPRNILNNKVKKWNEEREEAKTKKEQLLPQLGVLDKKR